MDLELSTIIERLEMEASETLKAIDRDKVVRGKTEEDLPSLVQQLLKQKQAAILLNHALV